MKLATFVSPKGPAVGAIVGDSIVDLSAHFPSMLALIDGGDDFSARDKQAREMEGRMGPTKGKSFDTGNAIGPWIVTKDEIPDARALNVKVRINGDVITSTSSAGLIHSFEDMIAYLSRNETLYPGEFLGSGTVGGCCALESDRWLKVGDVVEIEFDRIGTLRNRVVKPAA